jgi:hypothetical protein
VITVRGFPSQILAKKEKNGTAIRRFAESAELRELCTLEEQKQDEQEEAKLTDVKDQTHDGGNRATFAPQRRKQANAESWRKSKAQVKQTGADSGFAGPAQRRSVVPVVKPRVEVDRKQNTSDAELKQNDSAILLSKDNPQCAKWMQEQLQVNEHTTEALGTIQRCQGSEVTLERWNADEGLWTVKYEKLSDLMLGFKFHTRKTLSVSPDCLQRAQ